ncbi:hypothetical protein, partial [Burkholderia alba]|uniref:hypothetical protein n=1 Tax=Burkholderia alba TaxID=2683677 RepID=UPI002B0591C3
PMSAFADGFTQPAKITELITDWGVDRMLVKTATPPINPDNCPLSDAYATAGDVSNHSQQAMLLTALNANLSIRLVISGCATGRPGILGIYSSPN